MVTGNFDRAGRRHVPDARGRRRRRSRRLVLGSGHGRCRSRVRGLPEFLGALPSAVMAEEMETPGEGQIRALVCFAGNPVLSTPNGERLGARARRARLRGRDRLLPQRDDAPRAPRPAAAHVFEVGNYDLHPARARGAQRRQVQPADPRPAPGHPRRLGDPRASSPPAWPRAAARLARGAARLARDLARARRSTSCCGPARTGSRSTRSARRPHGVDLGPLVPSRRERVRTPRRASSAWRRRSSSARCRGSIGGSRIARAGRAGRPRRSLAAGTCGATTRGCTTCGRW